VLRNDAGRNKLLYLLKGVHMKQKLFNDPQLKESGCLLASLIWLGHGSAEGNDIAGKALSQGAVKPNGFVTWKPTIDLINSVTGSSLKLIRHNQAVGPISLNEDLISGLSLLNGRKYVLSGPLAGSPSGVHFIAMFVPMHGDPVMFDPLVGYVSWRNPSVLTTVNRVDSLVF
jgi:hypothetical protein